MFCWYCRTIGHLSSNCSIASSSERKSCSSSCSEEGTTLIAIEDLNIVEEINGCTSGREEYRRSQMLVEESLESREQTLEQDVSEVDTSGKSSGFSIELEDLEENIYLKKKSYHPLSRSRNLEPSI